MPSFNMTAFAKPVVQQRRFKYLLFGLVTLSLALGLLVVPIEQVSPNAHIKNWFDGIWWGIITVTGVGTGNTYPVTVLGRIIGMVLACLGVLSFGLIISMFSMALSETKDKYYRKKTFEQLETIERKLDMLKKNDEFMVKQEDWKTGSQEDGV